MSLSLRALTVSVEYDDLLAVSLPRNARHFDRVLVVTTPADEATRRVVQSVPGCECLCTEAFYTGGAPFAKGLAVEEGLDALGRWGWLCIFDADTVLPDAPDLSMLQVGQLHTPRRRMLPDPRDFRDGLDWRSYGEVPDREHPGYCQFFHADDPVLKDTRPWYGTRWRHAAGCDSDFQALWPPYAKVWLPWHVLHLGQHGLNWVGRWTPRTDGTWPQDAETRRRAWSQLHADRRQHGYRRERFD